MAHSPLKQRKFLTLFIIGWITLLFNQWGILSYFNVPAKTAWVDSLLTNGFLLVSALLILQLLKYYLPRNTQIINIMAVSALLSAISVFLTRWILVSFNHFYSEQVANYHFSLPIRLSYALLITCCIALIGILWYRSLEQKEDEVRNNEIERMTREAELFKLRQQLQPHFLFNSLNSINALIQQQPAKAKEMVIQLSEFLRGTLKKEDTKLISLEEELEYISLYLAIEKVRFGNRLNTSIEAAEDIQQLKVPTLILQPIVENAIKYGLYGTVGETLVKVYAKAENNVLLITVSNPYDKESNTQHKGTGFGLHSIERRLYLLFGKKDLLQTSFEENYFTTLIKIPQVL